MHREQLNTFGSNITITLFSAVNCCETGSTMRNVAWSDEFSQFKKGSLGAHRIWVFAG